jgi:hypothetical protein
MKEAVGSRMGVAEGDLQRRKQCLESMFKSSKIQRRKEHGRDS